MCDDDGLVPREKMTRGRLPEVTAVLKEFFFHRRKRNRAASQAGVPARPAPKNIERPGGPPPEAYPSCRRYHEAKIHGVFLR
jgi:hypothetical protein